MVDLLAQQLPNIDATRAIVPIHVMITVLCASVLHIGAIAYYFGRMDNRVKSIEGTAVKMQADFHALQEYLNKQAVIQERRLTVLEEKVRTLQTSGVTT